jgi:hypothetical protein
VPPPNLSGVSEAASPSADLRRSVSPPAVSPAWRRLLGVPGIWLAALLLALPSLFVGFSNDDLAHRLMLEGKDPGYSEGWFGLYDFTPPDFPARRAMDLGLFPWFTDPGLSLRFFRPLSSLSLALDHALFGRNAVLAHAQTLLWFLLLVAVASRLYRRWFTAPAALLATLVFGLSGVHAIPLSWIASRHTLIAATLGLLSLWAWARYREDRFTAGAPLALVALLAGLAASESALVAVPLLAAYELGTRGLKRGLRGASLPLGVALAYLILYACFGYGVKQSGFYVSPFETPLSYLAAAFWGVPALLAELLLGMPSIVSGMQGRSGQIMFLVLGLGAAFGALCLLRSLSRALPERTRRTLLWSSLGTALGLSALVGVLVSGRVLPLPEFAAAGLGGNALWAAWRLARGHEPSSGRKRWWGALALVALFQLAIPVLLRLAMPSQFAHQGDVERRLAEQADVGPCNRGGSIYLVNGADPTLTLYAAAAVLFYTPDQAHAERWRVLSMAPQAQRLIRTSPSALELEVLGTPRQKTPFEPLFRRLDRPLRVGQNVQLPELTATVLSSAEDGLFTRVRFQFLADLDPARDCLLAWHGGKLNFVPLPEPGASVRIEHEPGPMGL